MNDNLCLNYENTAIRVRMTKRGPEFNLCDLEAATGKRAEHVLHDLFSYISEGLMKDVFGISVPHLISSDMLHHAYQVVETIDPENKRRWFFKAMMLVAAANFAALEEMGNAES